MSSFNLRSKFKNGVAYLEDAYGGAAIIMALMTPVVIGGLAFGAEVGGWELTKRKIQNAADIAAYAAGTQIRSGKSGSALDSAALQVAAQSGYKSGSTGLQVEFPPSSAPNVPDSQNPGTFVDPNGDNEYVYVILTETVRRNFTRYFARGSNTVDIVSAAVARIQNGRPACVLSLAPNSSDAISVSGSTTVTLGGCDLAANSLASDAVTQNGNANLEADCISTVGGTDFNKPLNITLNDCTAPIENSPYTPDPYRNRSAPAVPALPAACANPGESKKFTTNPHNSGTPAPTYAGLNVTSSTPRTGPVYCGSGNMTVQGDTTLSPGVYVLSGGNWKIGSIGNLIGDDVTLYLTNGASLDFNGSGTVDLSAPTLGDYAGLVVYFDRNNAGSSTINGNSNFSLVGAVYGAKQNITFSGNTTGSGPGECTQIIGYTVSFTGNSDFDTDCSQSGTTAILAGQSIKVVG